jgi:hypothetical protein
MSFSPLLMPVKRNPTDLGGARQAVMNNQSTRAGKIGLVISHVLRPILSMKETDSGEGFQRY